MTNWSILTTIYDEQVLLRTENNGDVLCVPFAEDNRHYQEYLTWLAEGNEPEIINEVE